MTQEVLHRLYGLYLAHPHVTTDTRKIQPGTIFFALRGANFNGNLFAKEALEKGCAAAVVDDAEIAAADERLVLVPDVLEALQALAAEHRRALATPIVQITGTNGKTTTKELTAAVLAKKYRTLFTLGNLNNHIGVPLTLLRLTAEHDIAVIETGANHPGEIRDLTAIVHPNEGLITNVGLAHIEGFGSLEGVVNTKCELYDYLRKNRGTVFLHADNTTLRERSEGIRTVAYGSVGTADFVEGEAVEGEVFLTLRWRINGGEWHITPMQLIGAYNVPNALAAIAVGATHGVTENDIDHALQEYRPTNSRSELRRTERNTLIVDAYNANLSSMTAALDNFQTIDHAHKCVILGDMRELGEMSDDAHTAVAKKLGEMHLEEIVLTGEGYRRIWEGICKEISSRSPETNLSWMADTDEIRDKYSKTPAREKLILIKGSNANHLERIVDLF